jgi:isoquinoline 1-oxidoreductase beta subunit
VPPYILPNFALDHYPADIGIPVGQFRGGAHGASAFFIESFIDELSKVSGIEPLSLRMGLLSANPRLALCLSRAAMKGGWQGAEPGSGQGLACHMMRGSHIAVMAEARMGDDQRVRVTKLVCVADIGRVINPDIARQQIEGGLLMGMGAAIGTPVTLRRGLPGPARLGALGLPRLADMPEIDVELIVSREKPGGVSDIAVPPVAPAIANALFAGGGRRFRSLPLGGNTR